MVLCSLLEMCVQSLKLSIQAISYRSLWSVHHPETFLNRIYWKKSKWSSCQKHLYKGLSKNRYSVDPSDLPIGLSVYIRNIYFHEHLRVLLLLLFFCCVLDCNLSSKNLLSLFLCFFKKSDALYFFPVNLSLLIVID